MGSSTFVLMIVLFLSCIADSFQVSDDFADQVLKAHNNFRKIHGVPDLSLDDNLNKEATALAEKFAKRGSLNIHGGDSDDYGVNFGYYPKEQDTGYRAVVSWYEQICQKDYFKNLDNYIVVNAGHFTQVVWKGSKKIGVGTAASKLNGHENLYVAVLYDPAGNLISTGKENVPSGKFEKNMCEDLLKIAKGN